MTITGGNAFISQQQLNYDLIISRGGHLRRNNSGATISLAIALAPQLFLNGCADACAASI